MSIFDRFRLDGKRLFITGGSRGLGREMALAIADAGADVVLTGRDADSLEKTAADIRALGRQAWTVRADVSQMPACEDACRQALAHGPIDILINNVGGRRERALGAHPPGGDRDVQGADPDGRFRPARGSGPAGRLPRQRRVALHDRGGAGDRWGIHAVVSFQRSAVSYQPEEKPVDS